MSSGLIVAPEGFTKTRRHETLTKDEVDLVMKFEAWCQRRHLVLDLLCRDCLDAGEGKASRLRGDNRRDALSYHITCAHADRIYGDDSVR